MVATATGFRAFEGDGVGASGARRIVAYRLDPGTLAVCELAGDRDELFGYPAEEWGRPDFWIEHLHPDDRDPARAFWLDWARNRRSHEMQYRVIDPAGRVLWIHDIIEVAPGADGDHEIRGVLVDITERVAREAEAGQALRLRDELLRIVGEELAQPVRTISAYAELLGRHLSAQRDDVGSDYAIAVRGGVQRLEALLARLMRLAQGGGMSLAEMAQSLGEIRASRRGRD